MEAVIAVQTYQKISCMFFGECPPVRSFWNGLKEILHLATPVSFSSIILGTCDKNGPLTLVSLRLSVLLAKSYIWQCKCACNVPLLNGFRAFANRYLSIESYIAQCSGKKSKYDDQFGQLAALLRQNV